MILDLYKQLKKVTDEEYDEIVENTEIIFSYSGRARKLRIKLIDNTFIDVWYSLDGKYSMHWEQSPVRNRIFRHDNAPHNTWSFLSTFPRHCHDGNQENVVESNLSTEPQKALREFLSLVRKKMINMKHLED